MSHQTAFCRLLSACVFMLAGISSPSVVAGQGCPGDATNNRAVDADDIVAVIEDWARTSTTHIVQGTNFQFIPETLQASAGDTITWQHVVGLHTVTSGSLCNPDNLFDSPLTSFTPQFSYTLSAANVGLLEYFCDPHCGPGMSGVIEVSPFFTDVNSDGTVDVDDLLTVIAHWGTCS